MILATKAQCRKAGKRAPLPPTDDGTQKSGAKTYEDTPVVAVSHEILTFLSDDGRVDFGALENKAANYAVACPDTLLCIRSRE